MNTMTAKPAAVKPATLHYWMTDRERRAYEGQWAAFGQTAPAAPVVAVLVPSKQSADYELAVLAVQSGRAAWRTLAPITGGSPEADEDAMWDQLAGESEALDRHESGIAC